jgi:hypothetical protein
MTIKELKEAIDNQPNVVCGNHVTSEDGVHLYIKSAFDGDINDSHVLHDMRFLGDIQTVCEFFGFSCVLNSKDTLRIWKNSL